MRRVDPVAAVQGIVAGTAGQRVVAGAAGEHVGTGIAGQGIVVARARQILDIGEGVGSRADRVLCGANCEADGHAAGGIGIAGRVGPVAAIQGVVAGTTLQRVVAAEAVEGIGVGVAGQGVIEGRAGQVLDMSEGVGAGTAGVLRGRDGKADGHGAAGMGVAGRVSSAAAVQSVVACTTFQGVVAGKAIDHIVVVVAGEGVGEGRAGQVLDVGEGVGPGAAGILGGGMARLTVTAPPASA